MAVISEAQLVIFWLLAAIAGTPILKCVRQIRYYYSLRRPSFAPNIWVFNIVGIIVYLLSGGGAQLVQDALGTWSFELWIYVGFLFTSWIWMLVLFWFRKIFFAFIIILIDLVLIIVTLIYYFSADALGGWLTAPLALWILYLAVINYMIWIRNKNCVMDQVKAQACVVPVEVVERCREPEFERVICHQRGYVMSP